MQMTVIATTLSRIVVRVTIYRRLLIRRYGHLDQSQAYAAVLRQKAVSANLSKIIFLAKITKCVIIRLVYDYLSLTFCYWWKKNFINFDILKITLLNRAKRQYVTSCHLGL